MKKVKLKHTASKCKHIPVKDTSKVSEKRPAKVKGTGIPDIGY